MGRLPELLSVTAEARRTFGGATYQPDHAHYELEFNLIVNGKGAYFLEDGHHDLVPGTLVWLLPKQRHRLIRSPDLEMWVAIISPSKLDEEFMQEVAERPCTLLSSEDAIALDRLLAHHSQDTDEPRLYHSGLEYVFRSAWHACRTTPGALRKPTHPAVVKALQILRANEDAPDAAQLARMCGVSQAYLGQLLMEHTGKRLVEWRNRMRIERFHVLYPESGDLLTAALDAGFGSYTQFHRVFSEMVGTTPGEWAKAGAETRTIGLPSEAISIRGSAAESTRMIWYGLAELVLPAASRWFNDSFAGHFLSENAIRSDAPPIPSGFDSYSELRSLEPILLEQASNLSPARAEKLGRAFARNDLFEIYRGSLGLYGLGHRDLAALIAMYIGLSWIGANYAPIPTLQQLQKLTSAVRYAAAASGILRDASEEDRKLLAAALVVQTAIFRAALDGARSSGNDSLAKKVAEISRETALSTVKVDLCSTRLIF